jgi:hypothetical protein
MASRLGLPLFVSTVLVCLTLAQPPSTALAAGLDERGEAQAKEASQLYKQGHYEEAASIFAKLSVEYPEMAIFERNLGACFYYLRKPEPALSNLRRYLSLKKNIAPDDKAVVHRWIEEMERMRSQSPESNARSAPPTPADPLVPPAAGSVSAASPLKGDGTVQPGAGPASSGTPAGVSSIASGSATLVVTPGSAEATPRVAGTDVTSSPTPSPPSVGGQPYYKSWWLWGTVGAVVVAGVITAIVLSTEKGGSNIPGTALGNQGAFQ